MLRRLFILWIAFSVLLVAGRAEADGPRTIGQGRLMTMALSPDGTRLAAGTTVGTYFYDAATFAPVGFWPSAGTVSSVSYAPNGEMLVVRAGSGLQVQAAGNGAVLWGLTRVDLGEGPVFSPHGAWLAVTEPSQVTLYEAGSGALVYRYENPDRGRWDGGYFGDAGFLPDSSAVRVCCTANGAVWIDTTTWQVSSAGEEWARMTAMRPDGRQWAEDYGWEVQLFTTGINRPVAYFGAGGYVNSLDYSPDNKQLAVGLEDGLIGVWSVAGRLPQWQRTIATDQTWLDVLWSPDGRTLYTAGGNKIRAWDAATGTKLRGVDSFSQRARQITWSADGQHMYVEQGNQLQVFAPTGALERSAPLADVTFKLAWSQDRQVTARAVPTDLAASPTGDLLAVADLYGVTLHSTTDFAPVRRLPTGYRVVMAVFSPDGRAVATVGNSPFVVVWDVATGNPIHTLLGSADNYWNVTVAFGPDGGTLYALENSGVLRRWDLATETSTSVQTPVPACGACYAPIDPAIHPGVGLVATEGSHSVTVSRLSDGAPVYAFPAEQPLGITINAQGTRVAAIVNGSLRLWSLTDGADLGTYAGPGMGLNDLAFSPDGRTIAATSVAGVVQVWAVP